MATRRRDPEGSRDAILKAARQLFAHKGLHGVSMRDIAELAGRSQGLIHHYFGSKEELWHAVKRGFGQEFGAVLTPFLSRAAVDEELVAGWVRSYFEFLNSRRDLCRIMLWMQLEGDDEPWEVSLELYQRSTEFIRQSQHAGIMRPDLEPRHLIHALTSSIVHWINDKPARCGRDGIDPADPAVDTEFVRGLIELFTAALFSNHTNPGVRS